MKIYGALETVDRQWRIEIVARPAAQRYARAQEVMYRLIHGDEVTDGLAIATLQRLLTEAGVDMADLVEVEPAV